MNTKRAFLLGVFCGSAITLCILYGKMILDAVLPFIETHPVIVQILIALGGFVVTGISAWSAITRWHVKQRLDSWRVVMGEAFEQTEKSFRIFTRLFHLMKYVGGVLEDRTKTGKQKKAEIDRCIELMPRELPNPPMELVDMKLLHAMKERMAFDLKADAVSVMLGRSMQIRFTILALQCLSESELEQMVPAGDFKKLLDESMLAARKLAQWENLTVAFDTRYRDWLLKRKFFQDMSMDSFKETSDYKEIHEQHEKVSKPDFYTTDET